MFSQTRSVEASSPIRDVLEENTIQGFSLRAAAELKSVARRAVSVRRRA